MKINNLIQKLKNYLNTNQDNPSITHLYKKMLTNLKNLENLTTKEELVIQLLKILVFSKIYIKNKVEF